MKKTFAVTASGLLLLSAAAMAQTTGATHNPSNTVPSATSSTGAPRHECDAAAPGLGG